MSSLIFGGLLFYLCMRRQPHVARLRLGTILHEVFENPSEASQPHVPRLRLGTILHEVFENPSEARPI